MKLHGMLPFRIAAVWLAVWTAAVYGDGQLQEYCSSENTGSDYNGVFNIYNSYGSCYQQCESDYAFAIVQYQTCWCSNYIPADQQNTGSCNQKCPGYPDNLCGNGNEGLFGYISLPNHAPSGTAGASSSQASSTAATSSAQPTSTQPATTPSEASSPDPITTSVFRSITQTVTQSRGTSVVVSYVTLSPTASSQASTTTSTTPSSTPSSTSTAIVAPVPATTQALSSSRRASGTPSPVTSVEVVTLSGAVVTQTVTSTPLVAPDDSASQAQPIQRKGLSGGAIAGIVIGSILGTALLLIGAFLLWRRSKQNEDGEVAATGAGTGRGHTSPRRNISVLSRAGLLSRNRPVSYAENDDQMYHTGNNSVRHSMLFGAGANGEGVSPVSPLDSTHDSGSGSRRFSRPMVYDQRLNPSTLFANPNETGSRVSMQDQIDYSRPLGIANPDVRPSFESRNSYR